MSEHVMVSACLLGETCRWHGKKCYPSSAVRRFMAANPGVEIISVCPEMMGGLPVPRKPVKRRGQRVWETCPDKANRKNVTGRERTGEFTAGAQKCLRICKRKNIVHAILCQWSPSCDIRGITGRMLAEAGIEVTNTF